VTETISARQAFDAGLTRYFTGKPCGHGHVAERMISNGSCVQCLNERRAASREQNYQNVKKWREANPDARKAQDARYRLRHPETAKRASDKYRAANRELINARSAEQKRRMRALNPEAERERLRRFAERQRAKRVADAGRAKPVACEICGASDRPIVWDHCHQHGHFRGWICSYCNSALGFVKDSVETLSRMIEYLEGSSNGSSKSKAA
jgi:hypothetical protein